MAYFTGPAPQLGGSDDSNLKLSTLQQVKNIKVKCDDQDAVSMGDMRDWFRSYGLDPADGLPDPGVDTIKLSDFEDCTTFGGWIFMRNETQSTYNNREDAAIAFHHFPYAGSSGSSSAVGIDSTYQWRIQGAANVGGVAVDATYTMNGSFGAVAAVPITTASKPIFDSIGVPGAAPNRITLEGTTAGSSQNGLSITGTGGIPPSTGNITKLITTTGWTPGSNFHSAANLENGNTVDIRFANKTYGETTSTNIAADGVKTFQELVDDYNAGGTNLIEITDSSVGVSVVAGYVPAASVNIQMVGGVAPVTTSVAGKIDGTLGTAAFNNQSIVGDGVTTMLNLTTAAGWDSLELEATGGFSTTGSDVLGFGETVTLTGGAAGKTVTELAGNVAGMIVIAGGNLSPLEGEVLTLSGGLDVGNDSPGTGGPAYGTFGRNDSTGHSSWNGSKISSGIAYTLTLKQVATGGEFSFTITPGYHTEVSTVLCPDNVTRNVKWGARPANGAAVNSDASNCQTGSINSPGGAGSWSDQFLVYNGVPHPDGDEYGSTKCNYISVHSQHYN